MGVYSAILDDNMATSAAAKQGKTVTKYLLGHCMPGIKENSAKIRIKKLELDKNLLMYFSEFKFVHAYNPKKLCKPGDTVLIKELPEKMTRLITHEVVEVIYKLGDMTDPVTGKKVVMSQYRDAIDEVNEMYGPSKDGFNYEKAPPRGSLWDKRDFSHREPLVRYHDDPDDIQPGAVNSPYVYKK